MWDRRLASSYLVLLYVLSLAACQVWSASTDLSHDRRLIPGSSLRVRGGLDPRKRLLLDNMAGSHEAERAERVLEMMKKSTLSEVVGRIETCLLARNGSYMSVLDLADAEVSEELLEALVLGEEDLQTRLLHAVLNWDVTSVEVCLRMGADVDRRLVKSYNDSLLHLAVKRSSAECVASLLDHGARINVQNALGKTPLHHGVAMPRKEILELLLERGSDMELRDEEGATALWTAVAYRMVESVKILMAAGASPHVRDGNGTSLLEHARSRPDMPAAILDLIEAGARTSSH